MCVYDDVCAHYGWICVCMMKCVQTMLESVCMMIVLHSMAGYVCMMNCVQTMRECACMMKCVHTIAGYLCV